MSTKCSSEPSPVAFCLLCRHGQSRSPPAGGEIPQQETKPLYHRPLIRPSVRTGAPSPQGEGLAGAQCAPLRRKRKRTRPRWRFAFFFAMEKEGRRPQAAKYPCGRKQRRVREAAPYRGAETSKGGRCTPQGGFSCPFGAIYLQPSPTKNGQRK